MAFLDTQATGTLGAIRRNRARPVVAVFGTVIDSPETGTVSPNLALDLIVTTDSSLGSAYTVQWEVSDAADFSNIVWSTEQTGRNNTGVPITGGPHTATTGQLNDTTNYWWRARCGDGTSWGPWAVATFYIDTSVGSLYEASVATIGPAVEASETIADTAPVTIGMSPQLGTSQDQYALYNIGASFDRQNAGHQGYFGDITENTPVPYIWFIFPDYGDANDAVVVTGSGFGDTQQEYNGALQFNVEDQWDDVAVSAWQTFPPTANAYTENRRIDPANEIIDWHHTDITLVIPVWAIPDGYFLRVETDGP